MVSDSRQVDPNRVITRLSERISNLQMQQTVYEIVLEDLEIENAALQKRVEELETQQATQHSNI